MPRSSRSPDLKQEGIHAWEGDLLQITVGHFVDQLRTSGALDDTYVYPGTNRTFPSWRFEAHTIWGLTWRILGDLLAAGRNA